MNTFHAFLNYYLPMSFSFYVLMLTVGFCGPIEDSVTAFARRVFLVIPRSRRSELWQFYGITGIYVALTLKALSTGWMLVALFLAFHALAQILRFVLLRMFPQRGYLPEPSFVIVRENGQLRVVFKQ